MRTKSRARVAADKAKGQRPRRGQKPKIYTGHLVPGATYVSPMAPVPFRSYVRSAYGPGLPGDDMRAKFAKRGQRDLELSKAYTEAEVNAILTKYGDLS